MDITNLIKDIPAIQFSDPNPFFTSIFEVLLYYLKYIFTGFSFLTSQNYVDFSHLVNGLAAILQSGFFGLGIKFMYTSWFKDAKQVQPLKEIGIFITLGLLAFAPQLAQLAIHHQEKILNFFY